MKLGIIIGSHRKNSESSRVGEYISQKFKADSFNIIDLGKLSLPIWDEEIIKSEEWKNEFWEPISEKLKECQGIIIITPEYNGMVSPALKNFFLFTKPIEIGHKPALIISVSSGNGGAYPISELRMSSYKNTRICYIPEHIIIRKVETCLKSEAPENENDKFVREKIDFNIELLKVYSEAMLTIRSNPIIDYRKYPNGMS
ncbi:MAG: NAD(P)H-dependent oxidoreductase [Leptospiraceae bacterium]|nr:NAD(P)H-dependent oxidoreductase [Leptospiraceae bacterium]